MYIAAQSAVQNLLWCDTKHCAKFISAGLLGGMPPRKMSQFFHLTSGDVGIAEQQKVRKQAGMMA